MDNKEQLKNLRKEIKTIKTQLKEIENTYHFIVEEKQNNAKWYNKWIYNIQISIAKNDMLTTAGELYYKKQYFKKLEKETYKNVE